MNEQLSGRAVDRAIAEALGLVTQFQPHNEWWYLTESEDRGRQFTPIPAFHADANAVIDVCAARGLSHSVEYDKHGVMFAAVWSKDERIIEHANVIDGKFQEALARALLAALTAEAGT